MAWTDTDLASVRAAIASGVRKVVFADGRTTEYQNVDHLIAAERVIAAALAMQEKAAAGVARVRFGRFGSSF